MIPNEVKAALEAYHQERTAARWTELSQLWIGEVDGVIEDNEGLFQWQTLPEPDEVARALGVT